MSILRKHLSEISLTTHSTVSYQETQIIVGLLCVEGVSDSMEPLDVGSMPLPQPVP